ncbi:ABC transporter ATP-binding protein [Patescibacteria group bacterium]|nr:ABC transporter ATP-binding protein [Patescibacteria group bacterium]MBU1673521.1 ABC transporter ATP-binding protein [Patescibacteria group bacterium]MBU1963705.1 ABC transporter ATP-binding protein [Patescibacteria group bacterium]
MNENVIEVKNLKKHFGKVKAVDGVSFNVEKGEIFGFLGPNGAGKTTTIRCLMDFIRPQEGEAKILGMDAHKDEVDIKKKVGYLSGNVKLYDHWTGAMHIKYFRKLNGKGDVADKLLKRLDFDPSRKAKEYSSGNRQKLALVLAFMFEPEVMLFDEPTNALDPILQNEVYEMIEEAVEKGATVLMSSHNMPEVERVCDRVGIIRKGKMVAVEDMVSLKEKKIYRVTAYFKEKFNKKDFEGEGLDVLRENAHELIFRVKGNIDPVVKKLGKFNLKDLEINQASLEDIFLEYYVDDHMAHN